MRVVHIGFPKTATTFLQTAVFPRLAEDGFAYVSKEPSMRLFAPLIHDDDTIFDPEAFATRVREHEGRADRALFSYEGLTGEHYRSGFVNRTQIATRLKRSGFDRVIVTIRNQYDVLESAYKQHVKSGGVLRFREYASLVPGKPSYLHPRYFDYHLLYELYASIFGHEHVLVLQYEHLGSPTFLTALAEFLRTDPISVEWTEAANRSLSYEKTLLLRVLNHLSYSSARPSSLLPKKLSSTALHRALSAMPFGNSHRSFLDHADRAAIKKSYAESNRELAASAGITLAAGYP